MRKQGLKAIRDIINEAEIGSVFVATDFVDIADKTHINTSLTRLEEEGIIRRVIRGVYHKAEYNKQSQEYASPMPDKVADALTRNFGWTVVPSGDTALNLLGLSDRIPDEWVYVSDGTYKEYKYGNTVIKFKKTTNKEISKLSYKSALVVQAIKAIGKDNVTDDILENLKGSLTDAERNALLNESKAVTSWIYEDIRLICKT